MKRILPLCRLTRWEARAREARYDGLKIIAPILAEKKISPPHTWHAAEAFLLLHAE
jgi:hypothetical protein